MEKAAIWTPKRQKFMMLLHFAGAIINYASRTAMALCMPEMAEEFQWDKKQQGLVLSCFLWGYPITQIFGGYMADRLGAEKVILIASTLWSSVTLLTPYLPNALASGSVSALNLVILSRMVQGLTQGVHFPSVMSMISRHVVEKERTFVYSIIGAGSHGGTLFIGLFGSVLLHHLGWNYVFYFIGTVILALLYFLQGGVRDKSLSFLGLFWVSILYRYGDIAQVKVISIKENLVENGSIAAATPAAATPLPWSKVLINSAFWAMLVAHFAQGYTYFVFLFWLPTFFHDTFPDAQPWIYNVLPWLIDMAVSVSAGYLADYLLKAKYSKTFVRKSLNVFAELGFGVSLILISFSSSSFPFVLLCVCLAAAGHGFYQSTILMNPSDIAPNHAGLMFGLMNTFGAIPGFLGTYISGAILDATHDWNLMYTITGSVAVVGWAVFAYFGTGECIT